MKTPAIILVRPQLGENIGACARAMANFGCRELRLVAPRDGWPNPKAADTANKALDVIDDAVLFATAKEAVADCQFVLATTARSRAVNMPVLDTRQAMSALRGRLAKGERCAILFGPERTGLENEEVALADAVLSIPVSEDYTSLNISHAVAVVLSEFYASSSHLLRGSMDSRDKPENDGIMGANKHEIDGLFGQLETALDEVNFWRVPEKKETMWRHVRAALTRAKLTSQEVATWRGIIRALKEGR